MYMRRWLEDFIRCLADMVNEFTVKAKRKGRQITSMVAFSLEKRALQAANEIRRLEAKVVFGVCLWRRRS